MGADVITVRFHVGLCACLLVAACAVPVPPSGGPADSLPPRLLETMPRQGATRVGGRAIDITFSEAVDRGSFARAWSITPDMPTPVDVSWNGFDRVRITFPEPFRETTTYIFTIDTALRDVRNVAVATPISLAFATGPALDGGRIRGRIQDPVTGLPVQGVDVLLLDAVADDSSRRTSDLQRSLYRTQTGPDGRFAFEFLAERPFWVAALEDRNRNRQLDSGERWAVAANAHVTPDSTGIELARPLWPARFDTTAPRVVRVLPVSNRDVVLRLSEPTTRLPGSDAAPDDAPTSLRFVDSLGVEISAPSPFATSDPLAWQLRTNEALEPGPWQLQGAVPLADSTGLPVATGGWAFRVRGTEPEAAAPRVVRVLPDSTAATEDGFRPLWPRDSLIIVWSAPPDEPLDQLIVLNDTTGARLYARPRALSPVETGISRPHVAAEPFRVSVVDTSFTFRVMGPADTGDVIGTVQAPAPTIIELYPARTTGSPRPGPAGSALPMARVEVAAGTHTFRFRQLPGGLQYRLRAFVDLDGNGAWTPGRLEPWTAAEPLVFATGTDPVRARWESVRADTLTFSE